MAFGSEVATAFVRIRPKTDGFGAEAAAGVKAGLRQVNESVKESAAQSVSAANQEVEANRRVAASYHQVATSVEHVGERTKELRSVALEFGKVLGLAFGAEQAVEFGKGIIEHAASVQKQMEVVRSTFGSASEAVLEFSEKGAAALGISGHAAETTAARMGILFNNLGVGKEKAAAATVDMLKLAGSLSAIRGVDPSIVLRNLPLAIAGNLRSLKQLGIATDQNQIKLTALKLGYIQTKDQALTPATRALSIVAIATAKLGEYQAQAALHSGDAANRLQRLSAEYDNAKDKLGVGLLPYMSRLVQFLSEKLPGAVAGTITAFSDLRKAIQGVSHAIKPLTDASQSVIKFLGGAQVAVESLIAAFAVGKIVAFANAIKTKLIADAMEGFVFETEAAKAAYIEAYGEMSIATVGLSATIKSALISTGIGAIAVAIGIAAVEIINHWDTVKRYTVAIAYGIAATWKGLKEVLIGTAEAIAGAMTTAFTAPFLALLKAVSFVQGILGHFGIHIGNDEVDKAIKGLQSISTDLFKSGIKEAVKGGKDMADAFTTAFQNQLAQTTDHLAGIVGAFTDAVTGVAKKALESGDTGTGTGGTGGTGNTNPAPVVDTALVNAKQRLTDLKQQLRQLVAQNRIDITNAIREAKSNLISIGSSLADQIGAVIDRPFQVAQQKLQDAQDRLALLYDAKNAKLAAQAQRLQRLQSQLAFSNDKRSLDALRNEVALPGGGRLSTDPNRALAQLKQLASGANAITGPAVQDFIAQYQGAILQVRQDKLGLKTSALDARRQAAETVLGLKGDQLAVAQDVATRMKDQATRQINDLTANLARGAITLKTFNKRLAHLLASDHVSYRKAGELLGTAFALGFRANVKGIAAQAGALAAGPQRPGTGFEPKITRPELIVQHDQLKVAKLQREIAHQQLKIQQKTQTDAAKAAKTLKEIHDTQLGPTSKALSKNPGTASKKARDLSSTTG